MDIIVVAEDNEDHCVYYANSYDGTAKLLLTLWYRVRKFLLSYQVKLVKDLPDVMDMPKRRIVCLAFVNGKLNPSPVVFISRHGVQERPNGAQFPLYPVPQDAG